MSIIRASIRSPSRGLAISIDPVHTLCITVTSYVKYKRGSRQAIDSTHPGKSLDDAKSPISSTNSSNLASMRRRDPIMKRNDRHRPLAYEQLESKAAPSSLLLAVSGEGSHPTRAAVASSSIAPQTTDDCYETDQILQFVAEHTTGSERAHRWAALPSAAECAAADEMMSLIPAECNSLLVLGFYDDGTEL